MVKKDLISVIIPTYNRDKLIKDSVNSVLNQTYDNIEVIIVDDGSTDKTEKVIKKIKDKRIKYIKLDKNYGSAYAKNVGIKTATGTYITFQDSDDYYHPRKIEEQYKNITKNKTDFDFCKIKLVDKEPVVVPSKKQDIKIKQKKYLDELSNGNYISTQAIFAKKEVFDKIQFDDKIPRLQDFDLVLRIIPNVKVSYTEKVLVDLYRQTDSISNSNEKLTKAIFRMLSKHYELNNRQYNNLINWAFNNYPEFLIKYNNLFETLQTEIRRLDKENRELREECENMKASYEKTVSSKSFSILKKLGF